MEVTLMKSTNGALVPIGEEEVEALSRFKSGDMVKGNFTVMRNGQFHRKAFSLLQLCFEKFSDRLDTGAEYKGQLAKPCFETFREQFIILAGHYDVTFDIKGNIRLKAKSLSFANCTQERFEKIYSDLINAALKHVYQGTMSEAQLRNTVDQILAYA